MVATEAKAKKKFHRAPVSSKNPTWPVTDTTHAVFSFAVKPSRPGALSHAHRSSVWIDCEGLAACTKVAFIGLSPAGVEMAGKSKEGGNFGPQTAGSRQALSPSVAR